MRISGILKGGGVSNEGQVVDVDPAASGAVVADVSMNAVSGDGPVDMLMLSLLIARRTNRA